MKKNARIILSLFLCATASTGLCADKTGTGAAAFLKLPVDARSAAMGEAVCAGASGGMALFQNPAGLAGAEDKTVSFSHSLQVQDISYDVLGTAIPLKKLGVLGVGVQYLQYGTIDSLDNTGADAGSLSPRDSAFVAGLGRKLGPDVNIGVAVKYIDSKISGSASTGAMDFGLQANGEDLTAAFAIQNIGGKLKFNDEAAPLPTNVKLGVNIPYQEKWQWAVDLNFPNDGGAWLAAGAEYAFEFTGDWKAFGRAGYNTAATDTKGVNGISAGLGLAKKSFAFDYAFRTMGLLGMTHHLAVNYRWGGK